MAALSDAAALSAAMAKLDATLAGTADDSAAAQAAALWREVGADATKKRSFPSHAAVMKEVASADYSAILECPFDARRNHASAAATRTLCAHGAVARCRVEFDGGAAYTGLFAGAPECLIRLSTAVMRSSSPAWPSRACAAARRRGTLRRLRVGRGSAGGCGRISGRGRR